MTEEKDPAPKTFDAKAAIRQYQAKNIDWDEILATKVSDLKNRDWVKSAGEEALKKLDLWVWQTSVKEALGTANAMREEVGQLDAELHGPALRAVDANVEWLEAEKKKLEALEEQDAEAAAEAERTKEQREREIESFQLLKGMHDATKSSAAALGEIKAARIQADSQQADQAKFNKRMAWTALIVAGGSLLASVIMPVIQETLWEDPPAKPEVVLIQESDLTVPPLLRRVGG